MRRLAPSHKWQCRFALAIVAPSCILLPRVALADQNLEASDNASVDCVASAHELTRISLVGDGFASVSKVQPDSPLDDFDVVNEPTRGDIYISVPTGYRPKGLSFFGTSKKGFVYKFTCRIAPVAAEQIFLANRGTEAKPAALLDDEQAPDSNEAAVRLIQAMASGAPALGYAMSRPLGEPVQAGTLTAQLVAQYGGVDLVGRMFRIRNLGPRTVALTASLVAPATSVAVAILDSELKPSQETSAFVVMHTGETRP